MITEGVWDNIISAAKKAKYATGAMVGSASEQGKLTLEITTDQLHNTYLNWCAKNSKDVKDPDSLFDFLSAIHFDEQFSNKWADHYEVFNENPSQYLANPNIDSRLQHQSNNLQAPEDNNQEPEINEDEEAFGPIIKQHIASNLYKQFDTTGFKRLNQPDGLFLFLNSKTKKKMLDINQQVKSGKIKDKLAAYYDNNLLLPWKDIAAILHVKPTYENALLAIANTLNNGVHQNYWKREKKFIMSPILDTDTEFIINESIVNVSDSMLLTEALSTKLRQFFKLLAKDAINTGLANKASKAAKTRTQSSTNDASNIDTNHSNTDNANPAQQQDLSAGWSKPVVQFSRQEMQILSDLNHTYPQGLANIATAAHTVKLTHRNEITAMIKRIIASALVNLKQGSQ